MDKIWRLMTAMFSVVSACGMFTVGFIFSGGRFNNTVSVLLAYGCLFCVLFGIAKGLLVMIDYHREHKDEETDEE